MFQEIREELLLAMVVRKEVMVLGAGLEEREGEGILRERHKGGNAHCLWGKMLSRLCMGTNRTRRCEGRPLEPPKPHFVAEDTEMIESNECFKVS